jgi:hypothetical protein
MGEAKGKTEIFAVNPFELKMEITRACNLRSAGLVEE